MSNRKYSKNHEWVDVVGDVGTVGITDYAQEQLGDVVFIELPEVGRTVAKDEECAVIESVKAASEIYSPVAGEVTEINEALNENPAIVNEDAGGKGWFFRVRISNPSDLDGLMDEEGYAKMVEELE